MIAKKRNQSEWRECECGNARNDEHTLHLRLSKYSKITDSNSRAYKVEIEYFELSHVEAINVVANKTFASVFGPAEVSRTRTIRLISHLRLHPLKTKNQQRLFNYISRSSRANGTGTKMVCRRHNGIQMILLSATVVNLRRAKHRSTHLSSLSPCCVSRVLLIITFSHSTLSHSNVRRDAPP